jgi:hypothetical protein
MSAADVASQIHGSKTSTMVNSIRAIMSGETLPRIDTLLELLEINGYELSLSMRKVEDDDEEE